MTPFSIISLCTQLVGTKLTLCFSWLVNSVSEAAESKLLLRPSSFAGFSSYFKMWYSGPCLQQKSSLVSFRFQGNWPAQQSHRQPEQARWSWGRPAITATCHVFLGTFWWPPGSSGDLRVTSCVALSLCKSDNEEAGNSNRVALSGSHFWALLQ